ncbi:MAG: general secretion pathway protein GspK [Planctomycetaceae bacterium]|nr:type II secretion system protein GspK [Planctomycetota bacterium]NUN52871.1 general secretion pathway protein GspK [Planctomycetaceae bacterium]
MAPASPPSRQDRPQSGVALLIVLVVLFIVAVLMVDIALTASTARKSASNASSDFLMEAVIEGRFQIYAAQILYDAGENDTDSANDRWAKEEYADPDTDQKEAPAYGDGEEDGEAAGVDRDSDQVTIERTIEDEERKFNLYTLLHPDKAVRAEALQRLAVLIDRYREGTDFDISRTVADQLAEKILLYLERPAPGEGEKGKIPVPNSGAWRILTPDELVNAEGLAVDEVDYGPREILYDTWDVEKAAAHAEDPEGQEAPEAAPGLLRYLTLWSGTAWEMKDGEAVVEPDTWRAININTAEKPVLEALFHASAADHAFAEKIIEYRDTTAEGEDEEGGETETGTKTTPDKQVFKNREDLKKVEGIDDAVLSRNGIDAKMVTCQSRTFSLGFLAKHSLEGRVMAKKQVRYVIRRHSKGFTTLLREERQDPSLEEDQEAAGEGEEEE